MATLGYTKMTEYEWVQRCRMYLAYATQDYEFDWLLVAEVCYVENLEGFEEDPEACAIEEISYWND